MGVAGPTGPQGIPVSTLHPDSHFWIMALSHQDQL